MTRLPTSRSCSSLTLLLLLAPMRDMLNPFGDLPLGIKLMVENGMDIQETLASATVNAARALDIKDSVGTLTPGKKADFVVLRSNPLEDISALGEVEAVFLAGKRII